MVKKVLETIPGRPPAVSEHTRVKKIWSIWETRDCFVSRLAFYNIRLGCKKFRNRTMNVSLLSMVEGV
jgi:hypothetical protein